jgi:hypothetical protein
MSTMNRLYKARSGVKQILSYGMVLLVMSIVNAQEPSVDNRVKVGILNLEYYGDAKKLNVTPDNELLEGIKDVGFYNVFNQDLLTELLNKTGDKLPEHCRDPRCVLGIGRDAGMDRMLYGSVDIDENRCGIQLELIDIRMRQTIESVKILGDPGLQVSEVLRIAIAKLHGHTPNGVKTDVYHGPKIHNEKQFLISSAGWFGAGLLWGLISYAVEKNNPIKIEAQYTDEKLSGIPTGAGQIPLFARPAALANAYVAISDDAYGVLYNPAGLSWIAGPEVVAGYQYRFGLNNIGASYVNKATREIGFGQAFLYSGDPEGLMTEMHFITAAAYKFNMLSNNLIKPFSLGINLRCISNRVNGKSENSVSGNSFGAGIDIGLLWELSEYIRYGLLLKDLPVINKWKNVSTGKEYFEPNATTLKMGGQFKAGYTTMLVAEGQVPMYRDQVWKMSGGIEQEIFKVILLRAGIQKEILAPQSTPWKFTGGFGLKFNTQSAFGRHVMIDGSYEYNTLQVFDVINCSVRIGL